MSNASSNTDSPAGFSKVAIPYNRTLTTDVGYFGRKRHNIYSLLEIDITESRRRLKEYRRSTGKPVSFTAWITKCVAQAASEHPEVHAYKKGKHVYQFQDADISVLVEKELNGNRYPVPCMIRKANETDLPSIAQQIHEAQTAFVDEKAPVLHRHIDVGLSKLFERMPSPVRRFVFRMILSRPLTAKRLMGTIAITTVLVGGSVSGWILPQSFLPLCIAIGSVTRKPGVVKDRIEIRDFVQLTALFDHDAVDGMPAARFVARLSSLLTKGAFLDRTGESKSHSRLESL